MTRKYFVSSVSVSLSIFHVQQYTHTRVITNNFDDQGARAPTNSIFANQFKCMTRVKLRACVLKIATPGPHPGVKPEICNGGAVFGGLRRSLQPPETGDWGKAPSRRKHGGGGGGGGVEPPAFENFVFLAKIT